MLRQYLLFQLLVLFLIYITLFICVFLSINLLLLYQLNISQVEGSMKI